MADEIFRMADDFASSDIICSMKEQMTPSDAVVSSLLAKLAAYDTSSESFENTVPFVQTESSGATSELPVQEVYEQRRTVSRKSLWKYGSIAVAGLIVLVSTFSLIGDGDSSNLKNLIDNTLPDSVSSDIGNENDVVSGQNGDDSSDVDTDNKTNRDSDGEPAGDKNSDSQGGNTDDGSSQSGNSSDLNSTAPLPDDSTSNFDREILAEEAVSHLAISGTDYVVDTTASSVVTGSKITAITLKLPETSDSTQTVLNAQVKELDSVSSDFMVALDVEGFDETLVYMNTAYHPSTLGQFVADSGLNLNVGFSPTVYCKGDKLGYTSYHRLQIDDINELVDTYAFANSLAPTAKYSAYKNADVHVTFKTATNPTGSTINFGVSDNGYLYVKLSGGKAFTFNIGAESAAAFISAVMGE